MNKECQRIVFFIGAGFTKAVANTAPTGTEFLSKAFDHRGLFIRDERVKRVKRFIESTYYHLNGIYPNIEDVLSLIDYVIQKKEALSKDYLLEDVITVRNDLIYLIGEVIKSSIENSQGKKRLSRDFIEKISNLLKNDAKISIITTNYDVIIDNALLEKKQSCNYGVRLRYKIYWDTNRTKTNSRPKKSMDYSFSDSRGEINKGDIPLLKIHGSLNWFCCPKCDEVDITIGKKEATALIADQSKFLCANPYCTSNYEPLIVTPTMLKVYDNTFLQKLWALSENTISEANHLVFIGYSLPEADYHIRSLLVKALVKNNGNPRVLVIVKNYKNDKEKTEIEEVKTKYEALFGKKRIDFQPIGLESFLDIWDKFWRQDE